MHLFRWYVGIYGFMIIVAFPLYVETIDCHTEKIVAEPI